ncbi:MAG: NTP/NDP exchange transporter [Parachlamydiales bacterium]|nr:NTP/NDP exchange transporter [Parachlamydiales bacterium]
MSFNKNTLFGKLRYYFWPIHSHEYKKFLPMFLIFFLIAFNYNILRAAKDTLIITAPASGAETIPFIKVWFILPSALFMTYIFTRLSNRFNREQVFYLMMTIFLCFFAIFTFFLYPYRDILHPHHFADTCAGLLPKGLSGLIALFRNWTFTLFYVMSELWGTAILTVLFWGFANEVTTIGEAKRFYMLFNVGSNIAGIFAGEAAQKLSHQSYFSFISYGTTSWEQSVLFLNLLIIAVGIAMSIIFRLLHTKVVYKENPDITNVLKLPPKMKMSLRQNFSYIAQSKYLICIAAIVVTYHIAMNLIEIVWKNQVKLLYPNPSDYNAFMGQVMVLMGIIAAISALFVSGNLLRRFSWTLNALISPIIVLITGILFFIFLFTPHTTMIRFTTFFGVTPLAMCVFFGTLQNCFSRASKYTLFDSTKEMAFIPLAQDVQRKAKAAIDGVGSRVGKSGGSLIHQSLLLIFSTLTMATPYVALLFVAVIMIWITSARSLGKQFNTLTAGGEQEIKAPQTATTNA